jgi:SAM-dependent methyltransferase
MTADQRPLADMSTDGGASARGTYDTLAPVYDGFSADFDHETWVSRLLAVAEEAGASGNRVLDVACGTGKSFEPLLRRGYEVSACDISPAMVARARERAGDHARNVFVADMRDLPVCDRFDLITCLDDAVNYLLTVDDLRAAFRSAARLLRPGGFYLFDTNTLLTYRTAFAQDICFARDGWSFVWHGEITDDAPAGVRATATVRAESESGAKVTARHVQRHHPIEVVERELREAGFEIVARLGQTTGAVLHETATELDHNKTVFVARRSQETAKPMTTSESTIIP